MFYYLIFSLLGYLCVLLVTSCSFHYDQGRELEAQKRWEEASIEYRRAFIENPEDHVVLKALERVNYFVARDNFELYQNYLTQRDFTKAYTRLQNVLRQDPKHQAASDELKYWQKILLTGKVQFEFKKVGEKLRLAEKMNLEVRINSPSREILKGDISNESGIFIIEDLLYKAYPEKLSEYTLNSIGLFLVRRDKNGFSRDEYNRFINFRVLVPGRVEGKMNRIEAPLKNVSKHRQQLFFEKKSFLEPWYPPRLVRYKLFLDEKNIQVLSDQGRREFAPEVLYINNHEKRAFIDFGTMEIELNSKIRKWSILRKSYDRPSDDYFEELKRNLAINSFFNYDQAYRFVN